MNQETIIKHSPDTLISPEYHSSNKKAWFLLKILIKVKPSWASEYSKKQYFIFREIAYVNDNNELNGLGRSYLPINFFGLYVFWKCILIFNPKPLGVVLKAKYNNDLSIDVVSNESKNKILSPFKNAIAKTQTFHRIITVNKKHVIIVEEDFLI